MAENVKISVVIPVYNVERHIKKTLDSVLGQSLSDIEVICVDDCSTDSSAQIIEKYADDRLTLVRFTENRFAGTARNQGLDMAKGQYVLFIDADDFLEPSALEKLYQSALRYDSDITVFDALNYDDKSGVTQECLLINNNLLPDAPSFKAREIADVIFHALGHGLVWNKLYKTSFVRKHGIRFSGARIFNDCNFVFEAFARADTVSAVRESLINYRTNQSSSLSSGGMKDKYCLSFCTAYEELYNSLVEQKTFGLFAKTFYSSMLHVGNRHLSMITGHARNLVMQELSRLMFFELPMNLREDYFCEGYVYQLYLMLLGLMPEEERKLNALYQKALSSEAVAFDVQGFLACCPTAAGGSDGIPFCLLPHAGAAAIHDLLALRGKRIIYVNNTKLPDQKVRGMLGSMAFRPDGIWHNGPFDDSAGADETGVPRDRIFHFGSVPKGPAGDSTVGSDNGAYAFLEKLKEDYTDVASQCVLSLVHLRLESVPHLFFANAGYVLGGPLALTMALFLRGQVANKGIKKVIFDADDRLCLRDAFEQLGVPGVQTFCSVEYKDTDNTASRTDALYVSFSAPHRYLSSLCWHAPDNGEKCTSVCKEHEGTGEVALVLECLGTSYKNAVGTNARDQAKTGTDKTKGVEPDLDKFSCFRKGVLSFAEDFIRCSAPGDMPDTGMVGRLLKAYAAHMYADFNLGIQLNKRIYGEDRENLARREFRSLQQMETDMLYDAKRPLMSIIVPVYNCEKYIGRCIRSIKRQTLANIQVICVEDCSSDRSLEMLRHEIAGDPRFTVIEQEENKGPSNARNTALRHAMGDYVQFVDANAALSDWCCESVYRQASSGDLDMLLLLGPMPVYEWDFKFIFDWKDCRGFIHRMPIKTHNAVYKRKFIENNKIEFPDGLYFGGDIFSLKGLMSAGRISVLRDDVYYRGTMQLPDFEKYTRYMPDYIKIASLALGYLRSINAPWDVYSSIADQRYGKTLIVGFENLSLKDQGRVVKDAKKLVRNYNIRNTIFSRAPSFGIVYCNKHFRQVRLFGVPIVEAAFTNARKTLIFKLFGQRIFRKTSKGA